MCLSIGCGNLYRLVCLYVCLLEHRRHPPFIGKAVVLCVCCHRTVEFRALCVRLCGYLSVSLCMPVSPTILWLCRQSHSPLCEIRLCAGVTLVSKRIQNVLFRIVQYRGAPYRLPLRHSMVSNLSWLRTALGWPRNFKPKESL